MQISAFAKSFSFCSLLGETLTGDKYSSSDDIVTANITKEYVCNSPHRISDRYVFITFPRKTALLNLCEVQIYAVYEYDLTKTGSATQSSSAVPEMIADQGFDNDRLTCIATNDQTDPWWKIDLGSNHDVEEVVIYLPSEGSIPFSSECDVYVDQQLCGNASTASKTFVSVICSLKLQGKGIEIKSIGANKRIALCEVEVYSEVRFA